MSDRTIEHDLKFLIAVLNWAAKSRDERGKLLLASNPLRGLKTPTEENPTRVVLSEEERRSPAYTCASSARMIALSDTRSSRAARNTFLRVRTRTAIGGVPVLALFRDQIRVVAGHFICPDIPDHE